MSLEREDNEKGYNPNNCVWKAKKLQGRNRRGSIYLPHPKTGQKVPAAEVAEYLGITYQAMRAKYVADNMWPTEPAPAPASSTSPGAEDGETGLEDEDGIGE